MPSLDALLGTERMAPGYAGSPRGAGPVPGHAFGTRLDAAERDALIACLHTL